MNSPKPGNVNEYIAGFPKNIKTILEQIRATIKKSAPAAEELISYQMPSYKLNGILVYFAVHKNHIGFYATPKGNEAFKKEISMYKTGKGSIQFPLDKPIPFGLITKMVKFRVKENREKVKTKKTAKANYIKYHNDGSMWARGKMVNGKPDGYWEWYRKGGVIMRSGYFKNNKQVGEWTTYDKTGKVYKVTQMK